MDARKVTAAALGIALGLLVVALVGLGPGAEPAPAVPTIRLVDAPGFDDSRYRSRTFSLAIADLNGDGRDDVLIGAHSQNPFLLINDARGFSDQSGALFASARRDDRHGYAVADLDNDGRLDVAIASGGTDGVGDGWPNLLLRNESDGGELRFVAQPVGEGFALAPGRSRAFIPVASADGSAVDLYYTTLERDGYNNRLFRNSGPSGPAAFAADAGHFLTRPINDQGRGVLADLDGDGGYDYLTVENNSAKLFWHRDGGSSPDVLTDAARSLLVADFNNDALLDVFVGRANRQTRSDRMTFARDEMIFTLYKNSEMDSSEVSFRSASDELSFGLNQWVPQGRAQRLESASHIYVGRDGRHPDRRMFTLGRDEAAGKPATMSEPGIYIWFAARESAWHMRWVFPAGLDVFKGTVTGAGLEELARENFQTEPTPMITDQVFINAGGGRFTKQELVDSPHPGITQGATAADFNSDGWLDILGVRHGDQGDLALAPFVLTNLGVQAEGTLAFRESALPEREEDRLHRADQVAHGFLNADELPDAFITNGYGQIPGTDGLPRLLLNGTEKAGDSLLLSLRGTSANRFGLGAAVTLYSGRELLGYRVAGLNINVSQDTGWLHFGLGDGEGPYRVTVEWPDEVDSEYEIAAGGRYVVEQGGGVRVVDELKD